jgi:transcriptional regulator with XRE-family HTH domain
LRRPSRTLKPATISQIERGQNTDPRAHTLIKLARALEVTVDELVTWDKRDGPRPAATTANRASDEEDAGEA